MATATREHQNYLRFDELGLSADLLRTVAEEGYTEPTPVQERAIPVVLAGGSRLADAELLTRMEQAIAAGAIGCSVGRNIFMHADPEAITRALSRVIRERWTADKAMDALMQETA